MTLADAASNSMPDSTPEPMPGPAFSGQALDRADHVRSDPRAIAELRASPEARLLVLDGLLPRLAPSTADHDALAWTDLAEAGEDAELVFLGLENGRPRFAAIAGGGTGTGAPASPGDIWRAITRMKPADLALYGGARSLVDWHSRHRFCANCGHATEPAKGGWQRNCPQCAAQHFPRVDPVAIMLVEQAARGDLLLGRQERFPPRSFSALAGFIEPGETIEEAVAREVLEEAGVVVREVGYIASQPWPFPSQLMIGCHCLADSRELTIDTSEIEDARWFTRAEVAEAVEMGERSGGFLPPPTRAVAHLMLQWWLARD